MSKHRDTKIEFRYYELPPDSYVLPKLGRGWEREYGADVKGMLHFHNLLEIGYCYQGHGDLFISDRDYRYGDDMFTVIPANIYHTTESDAGNICKWEFLFIDMDSFIKNEMKECRMSPDEIIKIVNRRGVIEAAESHSRMAHLIRLIIEECREQNKYYKESLKGYIRTLVIEIMRLDEEITQIGQNVKLNHYVDKAASYIERHYDEPIKVEDLASECGLSESHFRRIFKDSTNMKPLDYVNLIRINKACDLLRSGDYSMLDVGRKVGYQTASSFNRNFRELTGMSPLQWRMKSKKDGTLVKGHKISAQKGW